MCGEDWDIEFFLKCKWGETKRCGDESILVRQIDRYSNAKTDKTHEISLRFKLAVRIAQFTDKNLNFNLHNFALDIQF